MFTLFRRKSKPVVTDVQKIDEILTRGVEDVFVKDSLRKKLQSGKRLRVKLGFDPTGDKIHIGRAVLLRKLKAFQDLGHQIIFLVGDFTAQIGDPSDKLEKRPMLTKEKIQNNLKTYKEQVGKIVDLSSAEFYFNSTGLSKLTLEEVTKLAESFSVQQMLNRRNFKQRFEKGQDISLREFLYPLMQGYDSVSLKADVEIGGFDQLFNLKAGRVVQKHYGQPEQDVLTTKMLEGTDGRKMSTSWGNLITVVDEPADMYGKVMSVKDELLPQYFLLCTDLPQEDIDIALHNTHPREAKMRLAREIVTLYHSKEEAQKAEQHFIHTFTKREVPEDMPETHTNKGTLLSDVLMKEGLVSSKSEYKRMASEGGIHDLDEEQSITDFNYSIQRDHTIRIGKKKFIRIRVI